MENVYIFGILIVILFIAVRSAVKRSKRKSCCSGSDYVAKKKKLKCVAVKKTFRVEGMHCQNCVNRVMEDVNSIPHVSAEVKLSKGLVIVSMEQEIADDVLICAIEKGGYRVAAE